MVRQATHRTIAEVTADLERWSYNTAVAHCMELLNLLQKYAAKTRDPTRPSGMDGRRCALALLPLHPAPHRGNLGAAPSR